MQKMDVAFDIRMGIPENIIKENVLLENI